MMGSKVFVHYVGTLENGDKFDSSRDRGDLFSFELGAGRVIKGWDEGVSTMRVGEKSKFTIKSHKAYGDAGSPPKIPGGATLVFEIELFRWSNEEDVSTQKDGSLLKAILSRGEGYKTIKELTNVTFSYTVTLKDGDKVGLALWGWKYDEDLPFPGLEAALKTMKDKETAKFTIAPEHAFGSEGSTEHQVPANATLVAVIKVHQVEFAKETWDLSSEEKVAAAETLRTAGNNFFKAGDFARALRRYTKAVDHLKSDHDFTEELKAEAKQKRVACYSNMAQCALKTKEFTKAREHADAALELDPQNVKALYRRAMALHEMSEWDQAAADCQQIQTLDKDNTSAAALLKKVKAKQHAYNQKQKALFKGLFKRRPSPDQQLAAAHLEAPASSTPLKP
ncbi:uncharacterized protein MONBRDRAFT_21434 [Monosiga brevicollis MX1]|uniref:peptidylprolyl isomerase n=1 Tax=Monosiga brevicollis TaxID=81824 RepID=A9UXB3_MONBE|nr:uncharacterized protein MONBRDRAFT_21434 [Monosiga brevicollis MX1]EDQ90188.1 predicted protein [Monosiga brevicollis MX1]|eukprot:XP_001744955.1 hypothetical protein [Monosiga brevicollis MX1]